MSLTLNSLEQQLQIDEHLLQQTSTQKEGSFASTLSSQVGAVFEDANGSGISAMPTVDQLPTGSTAGQTARLTAGQTAALASAQAASPGGAAGLEGAGATLGVSEPTGDLQADTATLKQMMAATPIDRAAVRNYASQLNQEAQKQYKANNNDAVAGAITEMSANVAGSVRDETFDAGKSIGWADGALQGTCPPGDDINQCMPDVETSNAQNQTDDILKSVFGGNVPAAQNAVNMPGASVDGQIGYLVGQATSQGKDATVTFKDDGQGNGTIMVGGTAAVEYSKTSNSVTIDNTENKGSIGNILDDVGTDIEAPFKAIGSVFQGIGKGIGDLFTGHAGDALGDVAGGFTGAVKNIADPVTSTLSDVASDIPLVGKAISSNISAVGSGIDNIQDGVASAARDIGHGQFGQAVSDMAGGYKNAFSGVASSIIHTPANVVGQIPGLSNSGFAGALDQGSDWLSGKADGLINSGVNLVSNPFKDLGQMGTDGLQGNWNAVGQDAESFGKDGAELGVAVGVGALTGGAGDAALAGLRGAADLATGDLTGLASTALDSGGGDAASGLTSMLRGSAGEAADGTAGGASGGSSGLTGGLQGLWDDTQGIRNGYSAVSHGNNAGQDIGTITGSNQQQPPTSGV